MLDDLCVNAALAVRAKQALRARLVALATTCPLSNAKCMRIESTDAKHLGRFWTLVHGSTTRHVGVRKADIPTWIWLVNYLHLHIHLHTGSLFL